MVSFDPTMLDIVSHLTSVASALGFLPVEDSPRWQMRRFLTFAILLVIGSSTLFIGAASLMRVNEITGHAPMVLPSMSPLSKHVHLFAQPVSVDPASRTITIDWYPRITGLENKSCSAYLENPIIREFHVSPILLDSPNPGWSLAPSLSEPLFTLNQTADCTGSNPPISYTSFRTVTKLFASKQLIDTQRPYTSSLQNYPFDKYLAPFSVYMRDTKTGKWEAPLISQFVGVVVNFEVALERSLAVPDIYGNHQLRVELRIQRSKAVQGFVLAVAITNWLVATAFLIIVSATLVYSPHQIYSEMFVVPVGALFAFTSIRANLPGAPDGFGTTLDMFSILPVLIIMSLCSFALLLIVLYRRISQIPVSKQRPLLVLVTAARFMTSEPHEGINPTPLDETTAETLSALQYASTASLDASSLGRRRSI